MGHSNNGHGDDDGTRPPPPDPTPSNGQNGSHSRKPPSGLTLQPRSAPATGSAKAPSAPKPVPVSQWTEDELRAKLEPKQQLFAVEYLIDLNATAAARRAGYSHRTAREQGYHLLTHVHIAELVRREIAQRRARVLKDADAVLQVWWDIGTCDVNEIVEKRTVCCRHCHGEGFEYQRTPAEYQRDKERHDGVLAEHAAATALAEANNKKAPKMPLPFKELGGTGYDQRLDPHPDCPECFGFGLDKIVFHDSRDLSPAARRLYAGVKRAKDGQISMNLRSQDDAIVNVAKHAGMFIERTMDVTPPTKEEAEEIVVDIMKRAVQRKRQAEGKSA